MAFTDDTKKLIYNYLKARQEQVTPSEAKSLLYTPISPGETHETIRAWLNVGVQGYLHGAFDIHTLNNGIASCIRAIGVTKTYDALCAIYNDIHLSDRPKELYTILVDLKSSAGYAYYNNQSDNYSNNKYGDKSQEKYYIPNQDNHTDNGDTTTMQGSSYIWDNSRKFKHLNLMLHKLWDITSTMPDKRFDAYTEFAYSEEKIAKHIGSIYTLDQIDRAHALVRQDYANGINKYGKPRGSKNKNKVIPQTNGNGSAKHDPIMDGLPNTEEEATTTFTPNTEATGQLLDASKFVQHEQLRVKLQDYARVDDMRGKFEAITVWVHEIDDRYTSLDKRIKDIVLQQPLVVHIKHHNSSVIQNAGVQHHNFPDLLAMCNSRSEDGHRLNVWLYGPAGTGKTTAAKMVSKVLTPGRFFSLPAMETGFQILGYKDAHGVYQRTLFRECWENGGTIIMDESDSYSPSAALAANGCLANGIAAFPDGMVERHPDCIIIAGANTTGLGGTLEYSGRMKLDAAFMDRWCMLDWPIDNALEASLCSIPAWLAIVRHCRAQVIAKQMKGIMVTPRATLYGASLLKGGVSLDRVMRSTIRKGMTDAQWEQVKPPHHLIVEANYAITPVVETVTIQEAAE